MALRAEYQPVSGRPVFWQDASTERVYEWSRWIELFEATLMAKSSISLDELNRDAQQMPEERS